MREQAKKLANTKRNQQIERERQATALSDMKQQCDDSDGKQKELKVEIFHTHTHTLCITKVYIGRDTVVNLKSKGTDFDLGHLHNR